MGPSRQGTLACEYRVCRNFGPVRFANYASATPKRPAIPRYRQRRKARPSTKISSLASTSVRTSSSISSASVTHPLCHFFLSAPPIPLPPISSILTTPSCVQNTAEFRQALRLPDNTRDFISERCFVSALGGYRALLQQHNAEPHYPSFPRYQR